MKTIKEQENEWRRLKRVKEFEKNLAVGLPI
jgi:hypothetical protein